MDNKQNEVVHNMCVIALGPVPSTPQLLIINEMRLVHNMFAIALGLGPSTPQLWIINEMRLVHNMFVIAPGLGPSTPPPTHLRPRSTMVAVVVDVLLLTRISAGH